MALLKKLSSTQIIFFKTIIHKIKSCLKIEIIIRISHTLPRVSPNVKTEIFMLILELTSRL